MGGLSGLQCIKCVILTVFHPEQCDHCHCEFGIRTCVSYSAQSLLLLTLCLIITVVAEDRDVTS